MKKALDFFKTAWKQMLAILGMVVLFFTLFDYFFKWHVISFVGPYCLKIIGFVWSHLFWIFILIWLAILSVYFYRDRKNITPPTHTENKINIAKTELSRAIEVVKTALDAQIKAVGVKSDREVSSLREKIIDLEIAEHLRKNQIGSLSGMLEKLKICKAKSWGVDSVLFEIKEYIKTHGMPSVYYEELTKDISEIPDQFKLLREEILQLAQEKLYQLGS